MYIQHGIFDALGGDEAVAGEVLDQGCVRGTGGSPGHSACLVSQGKGLNGCERGRRSDGRR
jgi:hypothetical protein